MRTIMEERNSLLNEFMKNCVVEDDTNEVTRKEFYKAYLEYVKQQEGDDRLAYCLNSIQKKVFDKFKDKENTRTHSNGYKFNTYPFKIIHLDVDYKEEPKKNTLSLYKENRKYSDKCARASIDSVHDFMDEQNYSRAFGQENYMQFKKFYRNYLEYCIQKCIVPMHRNSVYEHFKELGYNIIQKKERGTLWISINNVKNDKKEEIKIEDSKSAKITEDEWYVSLEDESSIRTFLRKKCNLAEIKEEFCAMKELYAFFVVLHKDTNISYAEFKQIVSSIPLGEYQLINGIEAIRYIPSYQYIEKLERNKNQSQCVYSCNNYFERVTKLKDDTLKMLCHLMDIGAYKNEKEEEIVEDVSVVKEETNPADIEIEKTIDDNNKSESSSSSNESFDIIDNGIVDIENENSVLFYKYHIIKSDLKIIVQKYRDSVHDELKHVFDMYIKLSIEDMKNAESKEEVDKIVGSLIEKSDNLTKFVKK